jgi:hypothetical protein
MKIWFLFLWGSLSLKALDRITIELSSPRIFVIREDLDNQILRVFLKNTNAFELENLFSFSELIPKITVREINGDSEVFFSFSSEFVKWSAFLRSSDISWRLIFDFWESKPNYWYQSFSSRSSKFHWVGDLTQASSLFLPRLELFLSFLMTQNFKSFLPYLHKEEKKNLIF